MTGKKKKSWTNQINIVSATILKWPIILDAMILMYLCKTMRRFRYSKECGLNI